MEQGQEEVRGRGSNGWEGAREGRSNGWPLGLQPLMMNGAAAAAAARTCTGLIDATPSLTSFSSSDFDTESTGSFFPEKSTTLGSLIGIQTSSQFAFMEEEIGSMEGDKTTRKSTGGNNRSRVWWSLLGCGGGLQNNAPDISPSLAHLLEKERRETLSQRRTSVERAHEEQEQEQDERFHHVSYRSGPYDNAGTNAPHPCGQTLRLILQQPSPTSYLSTDWNVFSDFSQNHHIRGHSSPSHGRFHTFWPSLCGRLSTGVAN